MGAAGKDRAPRIGQPTWIGRCCARAGAAAKPPLKPANLGAPRLGVDPASAEGGLAFGRRLGDGARRGGAVFSAAGGGAAEGGGESVRGAIPLSVPNWLRSRVGGERGRYPAARRTRYASCRCAPVECCAAAVCLPPPPKQLCHDSARRA